MKRWVTMVAATLLLAATPGWGSKSKPSPLHSQAIPKAHVVARPQKSVRPHRKLKAHPAPRHKAHKTGKPLKIRRPKH